MTALAAPFRPTLAEAVLPRSLTRTGVTVGLGALLTALAAQVALPVPGSPVPVTGQTFAVLLVGAALGPGRAVASMALYLVLGVVGLPVFTDGSHGAHVVVGATGGYLVGFLAAAAVAGLAARRGHDRSVPRQLLAAVASSLTIYVFGVSWLSLSTGMSLATAVTVGVVPFLLGDALKALLAAGALPAAWRLVGALERD
ncbi:biotin transporter BioY [Arthrobacter sp. NEB 688]|uniref:biotin transporter BioY n=1 Tax=Arthrobacter sp. NEB 688 TaxID=904039 RepID=UPI001564112C|nr:biotin transporter BioY [Arthrobacter sp. NEB 688]QKE82630.1 biotin transporter BioY [Arthrobacter sp. NEB 688]